MTLYKLVAITIHKSWFNQYPPVSGNLEKILLSEWVRIALYIVLSSHLMKRTGLQWVNAMSVFSPTINPEGWENRELKPQILLLRSLGGQENIRQPRIQGHNKFRSSVMRPITPWHYSGAELWYSGDFIHGWFYTHFFFFKKSEHSCNFPGLKANFWNNGSALRMHILLDTTFRFRSINNMLGRETIEVEQK